MAGLPADTLATPAKTIHGIVEKLKLARGVTGIGDGSAPADIDLIAFQDNEAPWIDSAIADLERLA